MRVAADRSDWKVTRVLQEGPTHHHRRIEDEYLEPRHDCSDVDVCLWSGGLDPVHDLRMRTSEPPGIHVMSGGRSPTTCVRAENADDERRRTHV